jgi:hypothetical protein
MSGWDLFQRADAQKSEWDLFQRTGAGNPLSDIVPEIKAAFSENLDAVKGMYGGTADKGVIQQTLDVGKGLLGIPGMAMSPITGAARAIGGHGMAHAVNAAGHLIDPNRAATEDHRELYEQAKPGIDQAMMAIAPRGASPRGRIPMDRTPTPAEAKQAAVDVYESPQIKNMQIPPSDVVNLAGGIQNRAMQQGFRPTPGSAPETFAEINRMTPSPAVSSVGVDDLRAARRAFAETAKKVDEKGAPTSDATAAVRAIEQIDNFLDALSPELRAANADYSAGSRAQMIDYRAMRADRNAAKSGSGMNMENAMRQAVDKIGDRGLSSEALALRDKIVLGTPARNSLRTGGKLGVDGGLSLMLHTGAGLGTGGMTLPITAAGTVARKVGEGLTRRQISQLKKTILESSPLGQARLANPQFAKVPQGSQGLIPAMQSQQGPLSIPMMPAYAQEDEQGVGQKVPNGGIGENQMMRSLYEYLMRQAR